LRMRRIDMAKVIGNIKVQAYPSGLIAITEMMEKGYDIEMHIAPDQLKEFAAELTRLAEK